MVKGKRKMILEDEAKVGDEQVTLIEVVLDESGSMYNIVGDTLGGLNQYIKDQTEQADGGVARFSLTQFSSLVGDEYVRTRLNNVPIDQVKPITDKDYRPNGGTPLLDAVGARIAEVDTLLKDYKVRPSVLFVVITDGEENTSTKYEKEAISKMVSERDGKGWTFVFMGANQDSWGESSQIGYVQGNTMNIGAGGAGMVQAYSTLSASTRSYRETGSLPTIDFFTDTKTNEEVAKEFVTKKKTTRPTAKGKKGFTSRK